MTSKEEIDNIVNNFKGEYLTTVTNKLSEDGRMNPSMTILYKKQGENEVTSEQMMIPPELLGKHKGKDVFTLIVPKLITSISDKGDEPICVAWSAEVEIAKSPKPIDVDNFTMPTKEEIEATYIREEGVVMYFESQSTSDIDCRLIKRDGMRVNSDGEVVDNIILEPYRDFIGMDKKQVKMAGRFTNLFPNKEKNE